MRLVHTQQRSANRSQTPVNCTHSLAYMKRMKEWQAFLNGSQSATQSIQKKESVQLKAVQNNQNLVQKFIGLVTRKH